MCISIEASILGALTGYSGSVILWNRNEGVDRGRACYFLLHGTWQALDALLWYDIDWKGNTCSSLNQLVSNTLLPYLICALIMFQMHFAEILLFMAKRPVYLTKWHAFKFILGATICYLFAFDEIRTYECTTILDMPTLISERILEWCNTEFSAGALAMYGVAAVVGYDDPAEVSKFKTFTTSTILYIAVAVVAAQLVFFRSFHLSLFCFFCFGWFH